MSKSWLEANFNCILLTCSIERMECCGELYQENTLRSAKLYLMANKGHFTRPDMGSCSARTWTLCWRIAATTWSQLSIFSLKSIDS